MTNFKFGFGTMLKDKITGYKGIVTARTEYFTGCRHYGLLRVGLTEKGGVPDSEWFDESRLEQVGTRVITLPRSVTDPPSGRFENPPEAR